MAACKITMPSYTYAMKGEKLCKARGISCEIRRNDNTSSSGCGYILIVGEECDKAVKILKSYSIPYNISENGG